MCGIFTPTFGNGGGAFVIKQEPLPGSSKGLSVPPTPPWQTFGLKINARRWAEPGASPGPQSSVRSRRRVKVRFARARHAHLTCLLRAGCTQIVPIAFH